MTGGPGRILQKDNNWDGARPEVHQVVAAIDIQRFSATLG